MTEPQINAMRKKFNEKYYGDQCHCPPNLKMPISQEDKILDKILDIAEMMISNLTYGHDYFHMVTEDWYVRNSHGRFDWDDLEELGVEDGRKVIENLWEEMKTDFKHYATVVYDSYTDSEGLTYNSVRWN